MTVHSLNRSAADGQTSWRSLAAVLAVGTFAVGTDAYVVSGLLPDVSMTFDVGLGAAGQLVTVFAVAYAVAAVPLGTMAARWSPRTTLLAALGGFALGNVLSALAPTYPLLLCARVVAAGGAALYTATATATAGAAAGRERRGAAIAVVMAGLTASLVLGAPLGTALGAAVGWRATLWAVAGLGVLAGLAVWVRAPRTAKGAPTQGAGLRKVLGDGRVVALLARTFLTFLAIFLPYTYVSAVYEPLTRKGFGLALLLLTFGLAASIGNLVAGKLADRFGPRGVIVVALSLLTVAFAVVPVARHAPVTGVAILAVVGWLSFSVTTPQQHALLSLIPDAGRHATAAYQAVLYAAVSASGAVGAVLLARWGAVGIVSVAAALTLLATISAAVRTRPFKITLSSAEAVPRA